MKKTFAFIFTFVLLFNFSLAMVLPVQVANPKNNNFSDVIGTEFEDAVLYLKKFRIVSGYPDGTFKPYNNITRAELTIIALEFSSEAKSFLKNKSYEGLNKFSDVPLDHWAKPYIETAGYFGIISGYEDGTFRPSNNVTFQEALTILLNVNGKKDEINTSNYSWPNNYISYSFKNGITTMNSTEDYKTLANRGNIAIIIQNINKLK